jgi:outer membrane protein assembly factor BamB
MILLPAIVLTAATAFASLGQPVTARNILAGIVTTDPRTGRETLVLSNNNEFTGAELIFVDLETGAGRVVRAPAGAGIEGLTELPGHRLALGTFYDGTVMVFDMQTMQFVKTARFGNETYLWGFAIGSDGRAYFGSFPGGKLGALDLTTYAIEDLGAPAAPNLYLRAVFPTSDGRILCHFIAERPVWLLYDPSTHRFDPVSQQFADLTTAARWDAYIVSGQTAFAGADLYPAPASSLPVSSANAAEMFGLRLSPLRHPQQIKWDINAPLTTRDTLYIDQGESLWKFHKGDAKLTLVSSHSLRGSAILGETRDGRTVGVRGQDYFITRSGAPTMQFLRIPGDASPRLISFLRADPTGRIWAGPPFGQTLCWLDPATAKAANTANISDSGGEVFDLAFLDGFTYAAAYSGGEIIQYDPAKPWDQWDQTNPRTIAHIGPEFIRPTGGITVGPGRRLYSGWTAGRGYGGAIAITDPRTGQTELIRNPLGAQQVMGVVTDGTLLYAGTGLGGTALPDKTNESPRFGIIDPLSKDVLWQEALEGANRVRVIGYDAATHTVVTIVDNHVRLFDTVSRSFDSRGQGAPVVASWSNGIPGDGTLYYGSSKQVLALDLARGSLSVVADAPGYVNNVTVGPDNTIYFGVAADLYAIRRPAR